MERSKRILPSAPIFSYIELTFDCNNYCPGCGNVSINDKMSSGLHLDQWEKIFQKIRTAISHLCLTGGEPTLYSNYEEVIRLVDSFTFSYSIFTNARWQDTDNILRTLRTSPGLAEIIVSIHGPDSASHDAFTGVSGSFTEACSNIRSAVAADLPVAIITVITGLNFDRLDEMLSICKGLGSSSITFSRFVSNNDNDISPTNDQLLFAMNWISEQGDNTSVPVFTSVCIPYCFHSSHLFNACYAGITSITIDPNGNVRPCVMTPLICGNLLDESLEKIWHSNELNYWRNLIPNTCVCCSALTHCNGGCRAAAIIRGLENDPLQRDPVSSEQWEVQEEIALPEKARPSRLFTMRSEAFGYILIRGPHVIPVTKNAGTVLQACDGKTSLKQLYDNYDQLGLDLIASLYKQGMIELN